MKATVTCLVPLLPFIKQPRRGQHLEHVVAKLVVGDKNTTGPGVDSSMQPIPVVIRPGGGCVKLACDAAQTNKLLHHRFQAVARTVFAPLLYDVDGTRSTCGSATDSPLVKDQQRRLRIRRPLIP